MKLGENIKNFRTFRRITQQELADYLGKSKSVISNWERGENSPDVDSCEKICKLLRVTPNELFGWEKCKEYEAWRIKVQESAEKIQILKNKVSKMLSEINELEKQQSALQDDSQLEAEYTIDFNGINVPIEKKKN